MSKPKVSLARLKSLINPVLLTSVGVVSVASFCVPEYSHARLNLFNIAQKSLPSQDFTAQYAPPTPSGYTWGVTPRTHRVQTVPSPNPGYNQQPIQPTTGNTNLGGIPTTQQTPTQGGLNYGTSGGSTTTMPQQTPTQGGLNYGTSGGGTTTMPQQTPTQGGLNYGTSGGGTTTMPQQTPPMSPTQSNYP